MRYTIPNQLTIFRIILTPVFVILIIDPSAESRLAGSIVFLLASLTDWYDGYFARRFSLTSRWGQFMDPLADKILVSTALVVFAYLNYLYLWMVMVIVLRDVIVTTLRSFALYIGKPIITSNLAKWKTFLQMGFIFALLIYINIPNLPNIKLSQVRLPYLQWTTLVMIVLVLITAASGVHYLIMNRSHSIELLNRMFRGSTRS